MNVLSLKFEDGIFHKCSCGYRPDRGIERVMQIILWYVEHGYNYIYDCDIKGFFDNIPHKILITDEIYSRWNSARYDMGKVKIWIYGRRKIHRK